MCRASINSQIPLPGHYENIPLSDLNPADETANADLNGTRLKSGRHNGLNFQSAFLGVNGFFLKLKRTKINFSIRIKTCTAGNFQRQLSWPFLQLLRTYFLMPNVKRTHTLDKLRLRILHKIYVRPSKGIVHAVFGKYGTEIG